jgi:ABC-type sugar transport system permease subunit
MTDAALPLPHSSQKRQRLWQKIKTVQMLYLLVLPSSIIILLIGYYPKIDVIIKSMYRWSPPEVEEFVGFKNFLDAFADPIFWSSFHLTFILLAANLVKMWPGIFAAVALHRISNDRLRYIFQVCFVVPMVIPGMVWLLIWKSFYDPDFGILNKILNRSGMMEGLNFLDNAMPRLATWMRPGLEKLWPIFGSTGGLILFGAFLLLFSAHGPEQKRRLSSAGLVIAASLLPFLVTRTPVAWWIAVLAFLILMVVLALQLGAKWVLWFFLLLAGLILHHGPGKDPHYLTLFGNVLFAAGLSEFIRAIRERFDAEAFLKTCGWIAMISGVVLILFGHLWTQPIGQFDQGAPAWLGNKDLVIPALLFWGFPWVGTMGVLIYLAGLQQIPTDVYEAAEIDGIGPIGMLFRIELPLILTQVRINLIFMTIGTLTGYEMFLILLGPNGGPGNRGMVPGLYMFKKAFLENQFGYACALGMVLFVIILGLTVIYNKYVKVEK